MKDDTILNHVLFLEAFKSRQLNSLQMLMIQSDKTCLNFGIENI